MTKYSDSNYDPGGLNSPGKGQSPQNPLGTVFYKSLGIVSDLSVYENIFAAGSVNSDLGFTIGESNFLSKDGFSLGPPGMFESEVMFAQDVTIQKELFVGTAIVMGGQSFKPTVIETISGNHLVLAAY